MDIPTNSDKTNTELYFEAQQRAKSLREGAIRELLAARDKYEMSIAQIDQQLIGAGYEREVAQASPVTAFVSAIVEAPRRGRPRKNPLEALPVAAISTAPRKRIFSEETRQKMAESQARRWKNVRKAATKKG